MLESDYFGYVYVRPPNYVVAAIIEDWTCRNMPIGPLCSKYTIDELTCRNVIHEVLFTEVKKPHVIKIESRV